MTEIRQEFYEKEGFKQGLLGALLIGYLFISIVECTSQHDDIKKLKDDVRELTVKTACKEV